MKKINCGGFYINEDNFEITDDGELKLKSGSGGGSDTFWVTPANPDQEAPPIELNASYNDIKAAWDANKQIILRYESVPASGVKAYNFESLLILVDGSENNNGYSCAFNAGSEYIAFDPDETFKLREQ